MRGGFSAEVLKVRVAIWCLAILMAMCTGYYPGDANRMLDDGDGDCRGDGDGDGDGGDVDDDGGDDGGVGDGDSDGNGDGR